MKELTDMRTPTTKTFELEDGEKHTRVFNDPVHFLDDDGKWQDIDLTPRYRNGSLVVDRAPYRVTATSQCVEYGVPGRQVLVFLTKVDGMPIHPVEYPQVRSKRFIYWRDHGPGVDLMLELRPSTVELWAVLRDINGPRTLEWMIDGAGPDELAGRLLGEDKARMPFPAYREVITSEGPTRMIDHLDLRAAVLPARVALTAQGD